MSTSRALNGVTTSIQTFRRELATIGHDTTLIALAYPSHYEDEPGIERVAPRYLPFDPEDRLMKAGAIRRLTERLAAERFDLVHIRTPLLAHYPGVRLADRFGVPRVETYRTFFDEHLFHYIAFYREAGCDGRPGAFPESNRAMSMC